MCIRKMVGFLLGSEKGNTFITRSLLTILIIYIEPQKQEAKADKKERMLGLADCF